MSEQWLVNDAIQTYQKWHMIRQRLIQENDQRRKNRLLYEEHCLERHMAQVNELYMLCRNVVNNN